MPKRCDVGRYLVDRMVDAGLGHIFGVPGDYVLKFMDYLVASPIELVNTCTESGAGFAADAYARIHGLGAVCVTYCVGGLNVVNSIAGAYAEKAPVVVISGAPGLGERARSPLLHHQVRDFRTQRAIFQRVTVYAAALEDPNLAPSQIDEAIAMCKARKRPVYLELPRDMVAEPCPRGAGAEFPQPARDADRLRESLEEASAMLSRAKRPVVLAGVEIHRFGLQEALLRLLEHTGLPVAATLLGKSVISERHPQYLGVYAGALSRDAVRGVVENSDCLLILGAFMSDINLGIGSAKLDPSTTIYATSERIAIKYHHYENVALEDFIRGLRRKCDRLVGPRKSRVQTEPKPFRAQPKRALSVKRVFACLNDFIDDDFVVIADPGDSLFGAVDLTIHKRTEFLSPAYYTSLGYAVPAALGAQIGAPKRLRPLVLVGDGAFQICGQELSTIVRYGLNPIVLVLNNKGYTTERFLNEGPYNNILNWAYHRVPEILGAGLGIEVRTEGELLEALDAARANKDAFSILNLHLEPMDCSDALMRLGKRMGKLVRAEKDCCRAVAGP